MYFTVNIPHLITDVCVDMGIEGIQHMGRVQHVTPDLLVACPTKKTVAFMERVVREIALPTVDDLPSPWNNKTLLAHDERWELMGPAQQDYLWDAFLTAFAGNRVIVRKLSLASTALKKLNPTAPVAPRVRVEAFPYDGNVVRGKHLNVWFFNHRVRSHLNDQARALQIPSGNTLAVHCGGKKAQCIEMMRTLV